MTTFSEPQEVAQSRESNTRVTEEFDFIKAGIDMDRLRHEPKSWYYAGNIRSFTERPKPISPWGKPLVAYRSKGNIVIQYRHCVHMNTDLVKGKVVNGQLVCPMHAWKFNSNGECTDIPGGDQKQCRLTLPSFHTHQIGSHVFVYRQAKSACPVPPAFPEFSDLTWDEFELDPAIEFVSDTPWYLVTANGFDLCHFEFVHGRAPIEKSDITFYSPNHCGIRHHYRNISNTWFDRINRRLMGQDMTLDFNVFDGNMILSKTSAKGMVSYMCSNVQPIDAESCRISIIPLTPKSISARRSFLGRFFIRLLRRIFIRAFFEAELRSIKSVRLRPQSLMESDRVVARYFNWLCQTMHRTEHQGERS